MELPGSVNNLIENRGFEGTHYLSWLSFLSSFHLINQIRYASNVARKSFTENLIGNITAGFPTSFST
jgi:hypothetical protein